MRVAVAVAAKRLGAAAVGLVLAAAPALAEPVDVELVLEVDSSGSIDAHEFELQRRGYAEALIHPEVLAVIRRGPYKAIALAFVEWSGPGLKTVVVPWTRISNEAEARAVAERIMAAPRTIFGGGTAIGAAIAHGAASFEDNGFEGARRVIDVSGDGPNNRGEPPRVARDRVLEAQRVTINGLAIVELNDYLLRYYEDNVIGGPAAFAIAARGFLDFASAVRRKLLLELRISAAGSKPSPAPMENRRPPRPETGSARPGLLPRLRGRI